MKLIIIFSTLLLVNCAIKVKTEPIKSEPVEVVHKIALMDPLLVTCFTKLNKKDIDDEVLNCYYDLIEYMTQKYQGK